MENNILATPSLATKFHQIHNFIHAAQLTPSQALLFLRPFRLWWSDWCHRLNWGWFRTGSKWSVDRHGATMHVSIRTDTTIEDTHKEVVVVSREWFEVCCTMCILSTSQCCKYTGGGSNAARLSWPHSQLCHQDGKIAMLCRLLS
jgi:hypothetical protein